MPSPKEKADNTKRLWTQQVGLKPHIVTAFERGDKALTVWLRWSPLHGHGGAPDKMSLGFKLRDSLTSKRDAKLQADAVERAKAAYHRLLKGEDPRTPEMPATGGTSGTLTIAEGLDQALTVGSGIWATDSEYLHDLTRYKRHVLACLPKDVSTWDQITPLTYQQMWRAIAHWRTKVGERLPATGEIVGRRACDLAVVLLAQAGRWLLDGGKIEKFREPQKQWNAAMLADWWRITGDTPIAQDDRPQPRYTPAELGLLLAGAAAGMGDPRIRAAFLTAGEARLGMGLECGRGCLDLGEVGKYCLGRLTVPDNGKKKGVKIDLTPELRAMWDGILSTGYLRELEALRRAGAVRTYPLFPGKRLVRGAARADSLQPIGDRGANDLWHEFERQCGVEVKFGRAWYAGRRVSTDLAEDVETDGRALNAITGHTSDEMRRRVYQQKERDAVLAKASDAREAARALAIDAAQQAAANGTIVRPTAPASSDKAPKKPRGPRQRPTYTARPCPGCGNEFTPTGPNTKQCESCSPRRVRPAKKAS